MSIKTFFLSILFLFLLKMIYNFLYEYYFKKIPFEKIKSSAFKKYKEFIEELNENTTTKTSPAPLTIPPPPPQQPSSHFTTPSCDAAPQNFEKPIETIFNIENEFNNDCSQEDMENCLLNLVINV